MHVSVDALSSVFVLYGLSDDCVIYSSSRIPAPVAAEKRQSISQEHARPPPHHHKPPPPQQQPPVEKETAVATPPQPSSPQQNQPPKQEQQKEQSSPPNPQPQAQPQAQPVVEVKTVVDDSWKQETEALRSENNALQSSLTDTINKLEAITKTVKFLEKKVETLSQDVIDEKLVKEKMKLEFNQKLKDLELRL
eukprot:m.10366 g.10366  ORF g.10366 m.10366 type:complete len:193 (+) comp6579_c1_seq2:877-1455(+)